MAARHWHERPWYLTFGTPPSHTVRWFPQYSRERIQLTCTLMEYWIEHNRRARGYWVCDTAWPDDLVPDASGSKSCHIDRLGWAWRFTDPETAQAFHQEFGIDG